MMIVFSQKTSLKVAILLITCIVGSIYLSVYKISSSDITSSSNRELLSSSVQITDGQPVKTYNGIVPLVKCPAGKYRPTGGTNLVLVSGQLNDGCIRCPRGRYGSLIGSTNPLCDAGCPAGRYGKNLGLKSLKECDFCPKGTYGPDSGLIHPFPPFLNSGNIPKSCQYCPSGRYSDNIGLTSEKNCDKCEVGYSGWQCRWPVSVNKPNQQANKPNQQANRPNQQA